MKSSTVKPPNRTERITLRLMILIGLFSMGVFLFAILSPSVKGYGPLYWMLITTLVFTCTKIVHEWIHYFCITVPSTPKLEKEYTVDIFTTFCAGEPYEMIEETLVAIKGITYPHKTYLCDEANDPYLKAFCKEIGVYHVTRTDKKNAKAGNINNALRISSGEICVILDPDHVPFPDFLDPIISHFNNPAVGFVQVVQAYKNNEENLIAKGAAQQTYQFYGPMMMSMNTYGTVLAIGANCTFRRTALESIGGHAAGLAEDMHTAMQLHSKGWKSVYVPAVLARGLVPSTLSAYYKQQLKWSRGVFELLVTSYPKLFRGFTWQQKLHYGIIPLHYLSGLIFLINFLIPILSLSFNLSPIHINIFNFGLLIAPMAMATVLIRHFAQHWVMEAKERGFHVVGGLLMIGTWWIFILGLFYTLIRKKVPYVPTPKDGNEANNWPLNIPNIMVLLLSLAAILYGLNTDRNPYSLIMAGFAGMNCLFMCFNIVASRQQQIRMLYGKYPILKMLSVQVKQVKTNLWLIRHWAYASIRSAALLITIILSCSYIYLVNRDADEPVKLKNYKDDQFLVGTFSPNGHHGLSTLDSVKKLQKDLQRKLEIVSIYIPWGDQKECEIPEKLMKEIYSNGSIPMITWEPWQNLFEGNKNVEDKKVFKKIANGEYNDYLKQFSEQVKLQIRPVYIRFAHEFDNLFYPWSPRGDNTADEFKEAWKYVYDFFEENKVYNVIWVWNPWDAKTMERYFPGKEYVDWIGVTNLNYGAFDAMTAWEPMEKLYKPFHDHAIFKIGLPVMLAEMGSLKSVGQQETWLANAIKSTTENFKEIKAVVFFNSAYDLNLPKGGDGVLDWRIENPAGLTPYLPVETKTSSGIMQQSTPALASLAYATSASYPKAQPKLRVVQPELKGMNYFKGRDWIKQLSNFEKRELINDLKEMKAMGIEVIKHYGESVYDYNILNAARRLDMKIQYSFWFSDEIDVSDQKSLEKFSKKVLRTISRLKNNKEIQSWNIGNSIFQKLAHSYNKPMLLYKQDVYLLWLRKLVSDIKKIDPYRELSIDIEGTKDVTTVLRRFHEFIPELDRYGLILTDNLTKQTIENIGQITAPYYFSSISVSAYAQIRDEKKMFFISNWQDENYADYISFNGVKDYIGRDKLSIDSLKYLLKGGTQPSESPSVKILKPAETTFPKAMLTYHALVKKEDQWAFADSNLTKLNFEWSLVKIDDKNNSISMKSLGNGNRVTVTVPEDPDRYHLYLFVLDGSTVVNLIKTTLNTPLLPPDHKFL